MKRWTRYQVRKIFRPRVVRNRDMTVFLGDLAGSSYARSIYRDSHEAEEREIVRRNLCSDDRVLEFGSGLGLITVMCCKAVGSEKVVTFEANPSLEPLLRRTFELNSVTPDLRMQMISMQDGQDDFFVSDRFVVSSRFESDLQNRPTGTKARISSVAIQTVLKEVRPTFLIVDIEGGEADLINPEIDLFGVKKLCIEVHPRVIGDQRVSELIASLIGRGFCLEISESRGDVLFFRRPLMTAKAG